MNTDELVFLGTGGGRFATLYQNKATGGILFNISGEQIHIDPGPGALLRAKEFGVNLWNTNLICLTHNHFDHVNDVPAILEILTKGELVKKGVLLTNETCYNETVPNYVKDKISATHILKPGDKIKINNNLIVTATSTKHGDKNGIGFKFRTLQYTISFVSDTAYFKELSKEHKDADILIINLMKPKGYTSEKHLCYDGTKKLILEVKPKACILTHFGIKAIKQGPLSLARELERETGIRVIAATDSARIKISNLLKKRI